MKPTSTLKNLAVGSLLLASILTGCKNDPPPIPNSIFSSGNSKMSAANASKNQAYSVINTFAGSDTHGYSGDGGLVKNALLNNPQNVYADAQGNVFISDLGNNIFRKVDAKSGIITTVAGNGVNGFSGDGGPATQASFSNAFHIVSDSWGNLYISDLSNSRIRRVDAKTGIVQTIAGTGITGYNGDGNPALSTDIQYPFGIAIDKDGNLVFSDAGARLRKMDMKTKIITTIAGNGTNGFSGDGGPATAATFNFIWNVAIDPVSGDIYTSDQFNSRIRKIDRATGTITTVAGSGIAGNSGMGGLATSAALFQPVGIAVDKQGNLFISDQILSQVYSVDKKTGIINLVAGNNGYNGFSGDGGPSVNALLSWTNSLSFAPDGSLYVNDANNNRVRKITGLNVGH